jgi:hypothetical protein
MIVRDKLSNRFRDFFSPGKESHGLTVKPNSKRDTLYLIALFFSAAFLLFFCSRNSPAFVYQDWVDPNIYMNVSRAIRNGAVLYRDIFDHKGPLLYLVLVVFSAITPGFFSMTGMYLLQCVTLSFSLSYLYRTARLFLNPAPSLGIGFGLLFFLLTGPTYGQGGGSVEELLLPVFIGVLYELVRFYYVPMNIDARKEKPAFFRLGLLIGIAAFVKINLVLFPAVITVFLLVSYLTSRDFKGLARAISRSVAGFFAAAAPCVIYFLITRSFSDFWQAYIKFNLLYAKQSGNIHESYTFASAVGTILVNNTASVLCILAGAICFLISRKRIEPLGQLGLVVGFVILFVSAFATNRPYPYLFIPLVSFVGLSQIAVVSGVKRHFFRKSRDDKPRLSLSVLRLVLSFVAIILIAIANGAWLETRWFRNEKTGVEIISEEILTTWQSRHEDTPPTILLFSSGDFGFYQLTRTIPYLRYFYAPTINQSEYPVLIATQLGYIRDGLPDYIIVNWTDINFEYDFAKVNSSYQVIDKQQHPLNNEILYITLYEKKAIG